MLTNYQLYLVLDDSICTPESMPLFVKTLIGYGVSCIQLRMKNSSKDIIAHTGKQILMLLAGKNIPLIINDHVDITQMIDADGVHLGQQDDSVQQARRDLGSNKIIGLSIENIQQAEICKNYAVDYFGVGPIFPTNTKVNAAPPLGTSALKQIVTVLQKPVIAIGGINPTNVTSLISTGVSGIAVISTILTAKNPANVTKNLAKIAHQLPHRT